MKLPPSDSIFGTDPREAYQRFLDAPETAEPAMQPQEIPAPTLDSMLENPAEWILLPGRKHGSHNNGYSYCDILVGVHRLGYCEKVGETAKNRGFAVQNTAKERDGHEYIGNITWEQGLLLNVELFKCMALHPRNLVDLYLHLKNGIDGKVPVVNGASKEIDTETLQKVYDEIFGLRAPYRGEYLDAKFKERAFGSFFPSYQMEMDYGHANYDGKAHSQHTVRLQGGVRKSGFVDLSSANAWGIPMRGSNTKETYCRLPESKYVAVFIAEQEFQILSFRRHPENSDESVGIRPVRIYKP